MKKLLYLFTFIILIIGLNVIAQEVITTRRTVPNTNTTPKNTQKETPKLVSNIKACKPYSESLNTTVSGIDFTFNVKILGWVNNKCRLDFEAKSTGLSSMFNALYGVDSSNAEVFTSAPKARCEFTQAQLLEYGDSILQEEARNNGAKNNMLKNPSEISFTNLSSKDLDLMDLAFNKGACSIDYNTKSY